MKFNHTVARATRVEIDPSTNDMYLVFMVVDEDFKQRVREEWQDDIPVKVIGKDLVEELHANI